jgi:hypothetical protein
VYRLVWSLNVELSLVAAFTPEHRRCNSTMTWCGTGRSRIGRAGLDKAEGPDLSSGPLVLVLEKARYGRTRTVWKAGHV